METKQLTPVKETLGVLVKDILEKSYKVKVMERQLSENLFGLSENEGQIGEVGNSIETDLFTIRNTLGLIIERLEMDISNLQ